MLGTMYTILGFWVGVIVVLGMIGVGEVVFWCSKLTLAAWQWLSDTNWFNDDRSVK